MSDGTNEDRARVDLVERLEAAASWREAKHSPDSAIGLLREAAKALRSYEKALRLIADDDYPEAWGKHTATAMRDVARDALRDEEDTGNE